MNNKVTSLRQGFHNLTPCLVVKDANKAIEFYTKVFGARENYRNQAPDNKSIMYAELTIGDSKLILSDEFPDMVSLSPLTIGKTSVSLYLYVDDADHTFERAVSSLPLKQSWVLHDLQVGSIFPTLVIFPMLSAFDISGIKGSFLIVLEDAYCRCLLDIFEYVAIVFVLTSTGATLDITANGVVIGHMNLQNTRPLNRMLTKIATAITPLIHTAVMRGSRKTLIPNSLKPQRSPINANNGRPQLLN